MTRLAHLLSAASLAVMLSGCELAPDYKAPLVTAPMAFKENAGWTPARPADTAQRGEWWHVFGDADLDRIEQQVTDANQELKEAAARFAEARALAKVARSDLYPTVNATAGETSGELSHAIANPLPKRRYDNDVLGLDASYELDVWGRVRDAARAANDRAQASAGDLTTASLSLHAEAAVDYLTLRGYDAEAAVLGETVAAYAKALELTQSRFKAGDAAQADMDAARAALELARTKASDVHLDRAKLEHAIAILTGQPPAMFGIAPRNRDIAPPAVAEVLPGELLQRRPDVAAAERRVEAANYDIGVARAVFYPSFSLSALVGTEARAPSPLFTASAATWAAGASGVLNLFDGGSRHGVREEAQATFEEAAAHYHQTVLTAYGEVEDNLAAMRLLQDEERTQAAAVDAATSSRREAERRYASGYASYFDVITAQNVELTAKLGLVEIRYRRVNADVLLIKALGGGWKVADPAAKQTASFSADADS